MCGLIGFFGGAPAPAAELEATATRMASALAHRGPDGAGAWVDAAAPIALGHRRLAIVDLSPAGFQPMHSALGRYVIAYNGEVYNHMSLRAELDAAGLAPQWRGHSDTETLLAGFAAWGIAATIARVVGMFAFALWDTELQTLTLGRDRLGEKPLYFGWQGEGAQETFLFGSELKALKQHPSFSAQVDRDALCLFLRHNYVPAPFSIYRGISKLQPGCLLTLARGERTPTITPYWSAAAVAASGARRRFDASPVEAVDQFEKLMLDAVGQQMMADVPLGAFLSGGVDSSTIVALMQAQSARPIKTFTIGFNEEGFNEAVHAKAVARHLGTEHTEMYVSPAQSLEVIPALPSMFCEPFADSSQIPTFLVAQLARQNVTVALSGDGGDELFCGYNRYLMADKMWSNLSRLPRSGRRLAARGLTALSPATWNRVVAPIDKMLPMSWRQAQVGNKLHKAAAVLAARSSDELYRGLVSYWNDPAAVVVDGAEPPTVLTGGDPRLGSLNPIEKMMALDTLTYLPDDILTKVDRAGMAASLESRMPFLDHRVVEFAWELPRELKLREGQGKWIVRELLYRHVPKELIERPKMGFGVPLAAWLRGPLRPWAEALLDEARIRREGYFHPEAISRKWREHLSGVRNWDQHLWGVLMFQAWLEQQ